MSPPINKRQQRNNEEIEFVRRFRRLNENEIKKALKLTSAPKWLSKKRIQDINSKDEQIFIPLMKQFEPIPKPISEFDWLANYRERFQDMNEFIKTSPAISNDEIKLGKQMFVYYVQLGDFHQTELQFDDLIEYSRCFFNEKTIKSLNYKIEIRQNSNGSLKAFCTQPKKSDKSKLASSVGLKYRRDVQTGRVQIKATSLFNFLKSMRPSDALGLIAFTEYDLYCDDSDLFVAGLCDGEKRVGVFSCLRYDPAITFSSEEDWFDYEFKKQTNKLEKQQRTNLLLTRSCRLIVHETCHLMGVDHCVFFNCCMNGSGNLEEDFRQLMFLCPVDLKKLNSVIELDSIVERYRKLREFFVKHGLMENSKNNKNKKAKETSIYSNEEVQILDRLIKEIQEV